MEPLKRASQLYKSSNTNANYALCDHDNPHVPIETYCPYVMALLTAPLGLIGVVLALNITRTPLGFMAILGIIALSGMIIRNSIILLDQIEIHKAEGQKPREAIINSATLRFRPIMLTALAAILGMIPLMGSVFWSPLAIAFSGGLLVATVLTLIVLPVMYASCYKIK